jgi:hypothetical protein
MPENPRSDQDLSAPAPPTSEPAPKVYISYSHDSEEHKSRVLQLSNSLREDGIDCTIDRYELSPTEGWRRWSETQVRESDFVLVICTQTYYRRFHGEEDSGTGAGSTFEGELITHLLQARKTPSEKPTFVPVIFDLADQKFIPTVLARYTRFNVGSAEDHRRLVLLLSGGQEIKRPPLARKTPGTETTQSSEAESRANTVTGGSDAEVTDHNGENNRVFDLDPSTFTQYAWAVLSVARKLGTGNPSTVQHLVAAVMMSGLEDTQGAYTGGWLLNQISLSKDAVTTRLGKWYPTFKKFGPSFRTLVKTKATVPPTVTALLGRTIDLARRLAIESSPDEPDVPVSVRHLLAAAVARSNHNLSFKSFLGVFLLNKDGIRAKMIEELPQWGVRDDPDVWKRILDPPVAMPEEHGLPTYAADSAAGPDSIGITREVEAMASLVSAWSVQPPLSIGLFGEWGSGKSFFMQKMKERVRQIASAARKSGSGQKEFGYYKNIVQVEFNAWHYVEGNLWASLVEHIFSNLRLEGIGEEDVDSEKNLRDRLEKLLGKVKEKTAEAEQKEKQAERSSQEAEERKKKAEEYSIQMEAEAKDARARAREAEEEGRRAEQKAADKQREADAATSERDSIGIKDIVEEVAGSQEIRNEVQKDLEAVGITKERMKTLDGLRDTLREASETGTVLTEGIKILANDNRRWRLIIWVVATPAAVALLIWLGAWLTSQQQAPWLQSIIGVFSAAATVIGGGVGVWKRYSPKLKPILEAVDRIKKKRVVLEQKVQQAREERATQAAQLDEDARKKREEAAAETKAAEEKVALAEKARREAKDKQEEADRAALTAQAARAEAERLRREAEALLPERRIAAFIQDRAGAKDYRRHLGVPALIRRDFEKLSAMFNTQRMEENLGKDGFNKSTGRNDNDLAIVNRIILYIDDLDRCPPAKVVEVLRAIHLLLAFPLFVVIVAVDARWMKRSLRDRFSLMLTPSIDGTNGGKTMSKEEELVLGPMATPDDYLEKIFQVPFWIRPLNETACKNLVNALTKEDMESNSASPDKKDDKKSEIAKEGDAAPHQSAPGAALPPLTPADSGSAAKPNETPTTPETGPKPQVKETPNRGMEWSDVEPKPRALQLTKDERDYMVELALVIGRSPRSVKRFVNCYRLLKTALDKDELARVTRDGTFRTTMLLLGLVSGLPDIAPSLLADLRGTKKTTTPVAWAHQVEKRLGLSQRERWKEFLPAIERLKNVSGVATIRPLVEAADLVDRFSFSPVRSAPSAGR